MVDDGRGFKYQLSATAYLATHLSKNERVKDYNIFYEFNELKPFDDILLAVKYNESEDFRLYLIQVKAGHVIRNINDYLNGYNEIRKEKKWTFLENIIGKINATNIQYWYFSGDLTKDSKNIRFEEDSKSKKLQLIERECDDNGPITDKVDSSENKYNKSYKLSLKDNSVTKNQDFFDNFYIYQAQPNAEHIENLLKDAWKLNNPLHLIHYLDRYLIKNKAPFLSKTVFEHKLLRMRLSTYIVRPTRVIPFEKEPANAWINLTLSHDATIIEKAPYTKIRLFGCIWKKISDKITNSEWNDSIDDEGSLSEEVKAKCSTETFKPQTLRNLIFHLWRLKEIPLILNAENELPVLKEFSHLKQHYIIIDPNPEKRYSEMKSYNLSVIQNLGGLQADELLQSISVSMQGKKPTSLDKVINGDNALLEALTCLDILKMIEPKEVYLKKECFNDCSNNLFLIGRNPGQKNEESDDESGNNSLIYCPCDEIDKHYEEALQNPKYKDYNIYRLYSQNSIQGSNKLQFDDALPNAANNSTEEYQGLEYFFIDQHGNNVYREARNKGVPIVGEVINISCPKYLTRHLSKGTIKRNKNIFSADNNHYPTIEYTESQFCEKEFFKKTTRKICVVVGEPGIGKSTFLRSLSQICCPRDYILFCDLALYQTDLRDEGKNKSKLLSDPLKFLCNKHSSLPYSNLLSALTKDPKRFIIILDSLDEVLPTYTKNVLKLIRKLNDLSCLRKIIIGSKLLSINLLSNDFNIDIVEIEGLNIGRNNDYIQNWDLDQNNIEHIPLEFRKNPLYLNFLKVAASDKELTMKGLNKLNLYKTIIDLNIDHYYKRKNKRPDETDRKNMLKYYYSLALEAFFPDNGISNKLAKNIKKKDAKFRRISIIKCLDKTGMPVFFHHTLLEYLVSRWLIETSHKADAKFIYEYILRNHMHSILYIYSEQFRLHKAVIDKDLTRVQKLCKEKPELLTEVDELGRTALHIAAIELLIFKGNADITDIIIQNTLEQNFDLYQQDKLLDWTWIDYCQNYLRNNISDFYFLSDTFSEAYWNYQYQIKNKSIWKNMGDEQFSIFCSAAFEIPSINIIKILLLLKHYKNKHLIEINKLALRSEINAAELPKRCILIPESGTTLMHVGSIYSRTEIVKACISRGDDIDDTDSFGCTPLYYGVCSQNNGIVKLLLENGAEMKLHLTNQNFITLFEMSLRSRNIDIIRMLIKAMDKRLHGWGCSTPLHDSLIYGNIEAVIMLLEAGADVNVPNIHGDTLLHFAVRYRDKDLVEVLWKYQPNVNISNQRGQTPIFDAIRTESTKLIEMLLKREADINIKDKEGNTPLGTAIRYDKDSIQLLLRYRADVNATNRMGETPLFHTIEINDIQKMEILVNADANVNIQDVNGNTALHIATDKGYSALIELLLLKANANVNIVNKWGETPLHKAVSAKSEDAVELLLKHQPDIYATNCRHETPLLLAVVKEHIPIIIHLLSEAILPNQNVRNGTETNILDKNRIYINMESQNGETPLSCAIKKENLDIVKILLEKGADVNYVDKKGRHLTPLFSALETENKDIVEMLLEKDANVNFKSQYGVTPFYAAVLIGNQDVVELLLNNKPDLNIVTSINTLLSEAKQICDIDGALGLLNYWAKRSVHSLIGAKFSNEQKRVIESIEREADIDLLNELSLDREGNNEELIHAILKVAAQVTDQTPIGIKSLNTALELQNQEIDRILLRNFHVMYHEMIEKFTDVGYAAIQGNNTMVKILLRNRENTNNISLTRVIQHYQQKHPVEILLQNQIDVNFPGENGDTPLLTALDHSAPDVVQILLENGADANGVNNRNPARTPLRVAIEKSRSHSVRMLLEKKANIIVGDESLLHLASQGKSSKIVHMLLKHGADPNRKDESGQTALHHAVKLNRKYIAKKLLEFEADTNIKDKIGCIPLDYVTPKDNDDIITMLRKKGK